MLTEPIIVTLQVVAILEDMNIPYFIGGSMATAVHGVARATMDVDLVVDIQIGQVDILIQKLGDAFYADAEMSRNAISQGISFNLIHKETMFKVDIFGKKDRPFDKSQFDRRVAQPLTTDPEHKAYIATPEDIILAKLEWFRLGGEVSDRQWKDILNVIQIQGKRLDLEYLREWANQLEIADLLIKALSDE
jgi:hypothetical protein